MKVTKADLKKYLLQEGCGQAAGEIAEKVIGWITDNIKAGNTIELRGFGTFYTVTVPAHKNRFNPDKTVAERVKVKFRPGKSLQGKELLKK